MRKFVLAAVLAASAPIAALTPAVAHADDASMYNLFVLGKMDVKSSDVEGRVAVAGDTKLDSYSVGALAPANTVNLVVGGNLTAGVNGGGATHGLTIVGGTATYHNWSSAGLQPAGTPLPVDFAAEQTRLYALTDALDAYAVTGTVTSAWAGQLTLSGSSAGLNVFDVSGATLAQLNTLNIDLTGGGTALINVDGTNDSFTNAGIFINGTQPGDNTYASSVLFNFADATKLSFAGIDLEGSVLAPHADYQGGWGVLNGQLIVHDFTDKLGSTQINMGHDFRGNLLDSPPPGIPEPTAWALLILGFGATGAALRRRRPMLAA